MAPPPNLETILIERLSEGAVLFSYNRPKVSNSFTPKQHHGLREGLLWARDESAIRTMSPGRANIAVLFNVSRLLRYPKVLTAAIRRASIGWECTQPPSNFDLIYVHQDAYFRTLFMPLGLVPEGGSSYTFLTLMGKPQSNTLTVGWRQAFRA
ncbi:hypothetical protein K469DRAFT_756176 [Zopfia rhizophila CBS 207.26]|uniref:ClpP/crotonase n=1 Tax=Zopfia rhizophila CBS 207.26 TaxID=1314779 RepID=A0A6A6DB89_9PEZI|nr:hypothetical protein K469DRAFT_756176 [Zopfia rhizophila CBS 207.26]